MFPEGTSYALCATAGGGFSDEPAPSARPRPTSVVADGAPAVRDVRDAVRDAVRPHLLVDEPEGLLEEGDRQEARRLLTRAEGLVVDEPAQQVHEAGVLRGLDQEAVPRHQVEAVGERQMADPLTVVLPRGEQAERPRHGREGALRHVGVEPRLAVEVGHGLRHAEVGDLRVVLPRSGDDGVDVDLAGCELDPSDPQSLCDRHLHGAGVAVGDHGGSRVGDGHVVKCLPVLSAHCYALASIVR